MMRFRIDLKIFIFLIIFYFTKQIELYVYIMFFAFIHELGHLMAGLLMGMRSEKLELMPFGVTVSFKINVKEYNKKIKKGNALEAKKIMVAFAGPITNLIIILIMCNLSLDIEKSLIIIYTNFLIMIFNLLPIYPLDGGRILKGILHINLGKRKAEKCVNNISKITVILITSMSSIFILYFQNISIALIDFYLWYLVLKEDLRYKKRKEFIEKILENQTI